MRENLWDKEAEAVDGPHRAGPLGGPRADRTRDRRDHVPSGSRCSASETLLTTLCLATEAPVAIAPAMNHVMWANPATVQEQPARRSKIGASRVLGPATAVRPGLRRSPRPGRMLEPDEHRRQCRPVGPTSWSKTKTHRWPVSTVMITAGTDAGADRSRSVHEQSQLREDGLCRWPPPHA